MNLLKTTLSVIALSALAAPSFSADFSALDLNADGQVSFSEYKTTAIANGKTVTLAAQEFTRMAQGDAVLTEDEFFLADALADQPYALQPAVMSQPIPYAPVETVSSVDTFENNQTQMEVIEPPVADEPVQNDVTPKIDPAPVVMEKPLAVDPAVAGEIRSADDMIMDEVTDVTPVEEGTMDLPEMEIEPSSEPDAGTADDIIEEAAITPDDIY